MSLAIGCDATPVAVYAPRRRAVLYLLLACAVLYSLLACAVANLER
jgi:hypothetical protein